MQMFHGSLELSGKDEITDPDSVGVKQESPQFEMNHREERFCQLEYMQVKILPDQKCAQIKEEPLSDEEFYPCLNSGTLSPGAKLQGQDPGFVPLDGSPSLSFSSHGDTSEEEEDRRRRENHEEKRKPNFTPDEVDLIIREVRRNLGALFGRGRERLGKEAKMRIWGRIAGKVRGLGHSRRTGGDVRKKWYDLQRWARKRRSVQWRERPGRGPRSNLPPSVEERRVSELLEPSIESLSCTSLCTDAEDDDDNIRLKVIQSHTGSSREAEPLRFQQTTSDVPLSHLQPLHPLQAQRESVATASHLESVVERLSSSMSVVEQALGALNTRVHDIGVFVSQLGQSMQKLSNRVCELGSEMRSLSAQALQLHRNQLAVNQNIAATLSLLASRGLSNGLTLPPLSSDVHCHADSAPLPTMAHCVLLNLPMAEHQPNPTYCSSSMGTQRPTRPHKSKTSE
ncbi:uncharacterized protein LOC115076364 [Rhinatrema bivittatum]|uniref:uncharacterized protein LOC115076364 n=1 Tax=Rhinatrema bivittatum TaxID=194408 RepID=UPI0011283C6D|nr:uncharacterized protein LOC115076364 [Rhinatrema bivittatum]XP_029433568.1 uncharacterized protein LOC115076364 [Rhinatrema bivittatum]XP_029433569.1 uncharacterized protein LOC115076364 [Rhinatrema bivittatum]XP_029433571.1 uncharacterized protein LOC115076364 [Rhinatrema bivittatum]XP_029433572.1 uncharacterized protein LOC115076364 [Rhinatrema bivittatum]XP_029433573.1 uncharacterized protein LOC115076364 [Rhinatrema bivittatum]XP_029433574.1 uncharacterized protein LOC115076364 [Rhinat